MSEMGETLLAIANQLEEVAKKLETSEVQSSIQQLMEGVTRATSAFCGSWIGYHSRVYYNGLNPPPAGATFNPEYGLVHMSYNRGTEGEWVEFQYDEIFGVLKGHTDGLSFDAMSDIAEEVRAEAQRLREELLSCLTALSAQSDDEYIKRMLKEATSTTPLSSSDFIGYVQPKGSFFSRDSRAYAAGIQVPPHISLASQVQTITGQIVFANSLASTARHTASHLNKRNAASRALNAVGTKVFIGHGRSPLWRDVKDFVQDRLNLEWDEFNRVPVAGVTNIARLSEMLKDAGIALVIMTAEDEMKDGVVRARENVVHEVGLFQGKLGFTKAIVLLEEGCQEFSNIQGLGQIRFPKGNIKAVFEDIRLVLEREGMVEEAD